MNTLEIEYRQIDDLIPYVNNSRTHSEEQVTQVASSIKEFGFTNPILVDNEGGIIAGHGRLLAARKLGMDEVPTIVLSGLSDAQRKAYVIADNQLALNSGWDFELLKIEIEGLDELGFDIEIMGFDDDFLPTMLADDAMEEAEIMAQDLSEKVGDGFELIITCDSEQSLESAYQKANDMGWVCRTSIL
jgi:ParB-like chromosome segregation protein Spo0J